MEKGLYLKCGDVFELIFKYFIAVTSIICFIIVNMAILARLMNVSISWSDEVIKILFIYIVYIGTALAYKTDGLIGITMLEEKLKGKKRNLPYNILKLIQHIVILIFAIFCMYQGFCMTVTQIHYNQLTATLELPAAISTIGFVIGSILWVYYAVGKVVYFLRLKY